ncbi:MAG: hypothetical protein MUD14_16035 [Hydrococcus sp. Prado102]|nr:hypothetical protein [Hydrococcus sp. Prado102]
MSSVIVTLEIFLFCLGGVLFVDKSTRKVSETLSLGIVIALMLFSVIFQVCFLLEVPNLSFWIEGFFCISFLILIAKKRNELKSIALKIKTFFIYHKLLVLVLFICWLYLFLLATIIPPSNWDSMTYNLSRIFLFQQENSLFLENVTTFRQSMFVVGSDILTHAFLRFYSDYGVGLFSFLAYISIGLGTYALSRNFASVQISLATTLVIAGMPEFCFQATSTKNDIFTAAAAVFCLLATSSFLKVLNIQDLSFIVLGLLFGISAKTTFAVFFLPYLVFFGYLIFKKYGILKVFKVIQHNWLYFVVLTSPVIVMSQIWLFLYNHATQNDATGLTSNQFTQPSGILGGIANVVRYLFQSFHLFPFDYIATARLHLPIDNYLENFYETIFKPIFGDRKMGYSEGVPWQFTIHLFPHEDYSWYGIGGFFLVIPAIIFSLFRGNKFLKATSLTLLSFMFIISYTLSWTPWNNRYLSLFFTASGVCIAFFLNYITNQKKDSILTKIVIVLSIFILISSCVLNTSKPLGGLSIKEFFKPNIWIKTNFGSDRLYYGNKFYKDDRIDKIRTLVSENSKVALVAGDNTWIYHFYLTNPNSIIEPIKFSQFKEDSISYDYLLCLDENCDPSQLTVPYELLWSSSNESQKAGKLLKIVRKP